LAEEYFNIALLLIVIIVLVVVKWFYLSGTCWPGCTRTYSRPAV